ncbi:hypothetical protein PVK06_007457 [Gossypium arboreum]|uniref:Uncharacterized protein n=1 Tax=Gossypium arboreum TaxID=29729 RepID=A0ABR0QHD0_GOSAR|nr:hypothetical protein PVK06_007457 [Gossypium arboreum]
MESEFSSIPDESRWPLVLSALFELVPNTLLRCKLKGCHCISSLRVIGACEDEPLRKNNDAEVLATLSADKCTECVDAGYGGA